MGSLNKSSVRGIAFAFRDPNNAIARVNPGISEWYVTLGSEIFPNVPITSDVQSLFNVLRFTGIFSSRTVPEGTLVGVGYGTHPLYALDLSAFEDPTQDSGTDAKNNNSQARLVVKFNASLANPLNLFIYVFYDSTIVFQNGEAIVLD